MDSGLAGCGQQIHFVKHHHDRMWGNVDLAITTLPQPWAHFNTAMLVLFCSLQKHARNASLSYSEQCPSFPLSKRPPIDGKAAPFLSSHMSWPANQRWHIARSDAYAGHRLLSRAEARNLDVDASPANPSATRFYQLLS